MRLAVICDLDGTVALMGKDDPERRGPYDYDRVGEDDPNQPIIDLVGLFRRAGYTILWVSGRDEVCRSITESWLQWQGARMPDEPLWMRPAGDKRPDTEIKLEIYRRHIEPTYRVAYVLDDRNAVVAMWREQGLTVLQVADGPF